MATTHTATLDRIIDGQTAVLLLEGDSKPIDQLEVDVTQLPPDARSGGAVLEVVVEAGSLEDAKYLPEETQSRTESAQERLDRLSTKFSERS
ncbi:DUF3006 domain-containing protein [Natronolimnobius sp. AArcel1]|uniref:DUF3006 domain-containing protein n=1 Tax=Natronolimnobius sp. AArcel1 TaxID=1679093 RepID=UPI0013EC2133|nr:DUF3006 domain-containing protein [Natronolimnobius sp. AArcel1]NGM70517.1 DUF3006 domain-containing protein [Natronolimnobius sp. AArcel1]